MKHAEAKKRIEKLRREIDDYRYNYHVLNQSTMSEAAADSLKHELAKLEEQFPDLVSPDSPTQRVAGEPLDGFKKVEHRQRMLSLNDIFDFDELQKWYDRIKKLAPEWDEAVYADLKLDGLACALIYENGQLERGITRGDGFVGEDVTANVRTIESIPLRLRKNSSTEIHHAGRVEVRGEIVIYSDDFEKLNQQRKNEGLETFANPRNTAAGTIRQLDPQLVASRPLTFHAYAVLHDTLKTKQQEYELAQELGFITNEAHALLTTKKAVESFIGEWEEKRDSLPYGTDGVVLTVNDQGVFENLGVVGKAPRGAAAYKYPAEQSTTKVVDILISIGRTGAATPVAVLEPVLIAGSTVRMASLHNEDEIKNKDVRIGDTVVVQKAGDIIPEIVQSLPKLRDGSEQVFDMKTALNEHELEFYREPGEAVWRTKQLNDPRIFKRSLEHFVSRAALDIDGMGEKVVNQLVDRGLVHDLADIFLLSSAQLETLEGFAELSAQKLHEAIQEKKNPPLPRFIFGLGIRHVGAQTAQDIAKKCKSFDRFLETPMQDIEAIDGIGHVVAKSIEEWRDSELTGDLIHKFKELEVWPVDYQERQGRLSGERVVITGSLPGFTREEAFDLVRNNGGEVQSSVGKETTLLVIGERAGSSKRVKAEKLGIPTEAGEAFVARLS